MKILSLLLLSFAFTAISIGQELKTPAPSPAQTVKQDFALSSVEISYSRPAVKGRAIFGDLVPYGKIWRTGANQATTITFGEDVTVGGKNVPAGKYGLITIPGESEWTVIINKGLDVTGPSQYKEANDVARIKATPEKLPATIESFMIVFENVKPASMDIVLLWDKTAITIPVKADVDAKVMTQIDDLMKGDNPPYFNAAMYYIQNEKDMSKASVWLDKAIAKDPKAFYIYHQKANALAKQGKKKEAISIAKKSIELAREAKNDDYVALNEKLIASLK